MNSRDVEQWQRYNAHQATRSRPRDLLMSALALTDGPGVAVDIGSGAGIESMALLDRGWVVHSLDYDETSMSRLTSSVGPDQGQRLHAAVVDLATVDTLPSADLIYSGFTLSWLPPSAFHRLWHAAVTSLKPGGLLATNIFGDHDDWAARTDTTCLSDPEVRELLHDLRVEHFEVEDADGMAFSGPKHWHVFDVIARVYPTR